MDTDCNFMGQPLPLINLKFISGGKCIRIAVSGFIFIFLHVVLQCNEVKRLGGGEGENFETKTQ